MLEIILTLMLGLILGYFAYRLYNKYELIHRRHSYTPDQLQEISNRLNYLSIRLETISEVLDHNYHNNTYPANHYDYSGYNFTGYSGTTMDPPDGWGDLPQEVYGPIGATGPALGGAVPSNTPPIEVDYLEEPRYS